MTCSISLLIKLKDIMDISAHLGKDSLMTQNRSYFGMGLIGPVLTVLSVGLPLITSRVGR